jgi:hypothetical protein
MSSLPDRELNIDEVISWSLKYYKNHFALLFAVFLAASIPMIIIEVLVFEPMLKQFNSYLQNYMNVVYTTTSLFDASMFLPLTVGVIIASLLEVFASCIAINASYTSIKNNEATPRTLIESTLNKYLKFLVASIALGLGFAAVMLVPILAATLLFATGAGGALLGVLIIIGTVVGSIYLAIRLSLYQQIVLIEELGIVDSAKRSLSLLKGRVLKMIGLSICIGLISMIPGVIMGQITAGLGVGLLAVSIVLSSIANALATPISSIALTVYYHSLRVERERPPPPAPPSILDGGAVTLTPPSL